MMPIKRKKIRQVVAQKPKQTVSFKSVSAQFSKAAKEKGITLSELLKDLKKIRKENI